MVTKKAAPKSGGDKTTGPVTTSDVMNTTRADAPAEGAAPATPARKAKPEDRPQDFETTPGGEAMQREEDRAIDEMDDRRKAYARAEKRAGVKPDPTIVPQGPSALRDWQVSANPAPQAVQASIDNVAKKQEVRKNHHR